MHFWPCRALRVPSTRARSGGQSSSRFAPLRASILLFSIATLIVAPGAFAQTTDDDFLFEDEEETTGEQAAAEGAAAEAEAEVADDAALGQAPPAAGGRRNKGIEELKVTGRKRDELLQEVPTSIRAFGAAEIEQRNMQRIDEIGFATANLQFTGANGSARDTRIYIRGIGTADTRSIRDPGVGLYIDNVYIPRATNALIDLVDLERIDVLRGPQGTLFGKNTTGGLVNVISAKPAQELGGKVRVNVGSFDMLETRASIDIPITAGWFNEKLYTRWTIATATDDGYLTNVYDDSVAGDNKVLSGRFAATLLPSEGLTLNTTFDWMRSNENNMVARCKIAGQESATPVNGGAQLAYGPYVIARYISDNFAFRDDDPNPPGLIEGQPYQFPEACAAVDALDRFDGYANPLARLRENMYGTSATVDWALSEEWMPDYMTTSIRNVFGFRLRDQDNGASDFDGTPIEYVTLGAAPSRHYAISNDVTATMEFDTGNPDVGVRVIVGAFGFYENEDTGGFGDINRAVALGDSAEFNAETYPYATTLGGALGPLRDPVIRDAIRYGSGLLNTETSQSWHTLSLAGYAHAEVELFEDWSVNAGLRYSWEKKERSGDRFALVCPLDLPDGGLPIPPTHPCGEQPGDVPNETIVRDQSASWHRPTPEAGVKYQINDDQMTYFRYAQGWKSGGFNREVLTERRDEFTDDEGLSDEFEPEVVNAYEVGFKSTWLDNQLLFNAALFWNDYRDLQITTIEPDENGLVSANITNAADAVTRGIEIETTAIPDWEWLPGPDAQLILTGGMGFTDAYYKKFDAVVADTPYPIDARCTAGLARGQVIAPPGAGEPPIPAGNCDGEIDRFVEAVVLQSVFGEPIGSTAVDRSENQFANVPAFNFNVSALYSFNISEVTIASNVRYYYQTEIFFDTDNSPNLYQPSYGFLDGSIAFVVETTDTRIEVWGKNLTNTEFQQGGFSFGPAFGADGVYVGRPRSFGMTLTQRF